MKPIDLQQYDIVKLRNGELCVILQNKCCIAYKLSLFNAKSCVAYVSDYYHDLTTFNVEYDIMAVKHFDLLYNKSPFLLLKKLFNHQLNSYEQDKNFHWDWERTPIKKVTMNDVENAFGCKVEIID